MNFKKSALMLSFAAAMSLLNTTVFAIDMSKSEVIKTTGKVAVKKTASPEFKKLNSNLKLSGSLKNLDGGDKVRTYNDSSADLALKNTCIVMVKEQSVFEVPKILTEKDLKVLKAEHGSILFTVEKGSNFQVQTADVICGVKGTMFSVSAVSPLGMILETPGLEIGYPRNGGTLVEVYEGEVEVENRFTKERISLKEGERSFWGNSLVGDAQKATKQLLKVGQKVEKFASDSELTRKWGQKITKLKYDRKNAIKLKNVEWFGSSDNYSSSEEMIENNPSFKEGFYKKQSEFYREHGYNIDKSDLNNVKTLFGSGKKFHANERFARISKYETDKSFSNNSFGEVYLGNNTLAACKAANGETSLVTEPIDNIDMHNGITFLGFGWVKMDTFNDKLGVTNELLANVYKNGDEYITAIRNNNNNLYWQGTDGSDPKKVPTGDVAYVYNMSTNKGQWVNAAPGSIPSELANYKFSVINTMNQEKKQVEKQNKEQKKDAAKKTINKIGNVLNKKGKKWF